MITRQFFILYVFATISSKAKEIDIQFANDYCKDKDIHTIVAFGCWSPEESIQAFRKISSQNTSLLLLSISNGLNMKAILKVNYYKLGVFLDLDCPESGIILDQFIDEKLPFNESFFWLLKISRSAEDDNDRKLMPLDTLERLPLSVNAELTLAVREQDHFELYDVYNPSYRHGGKLNVTRMGAWDIESGMHNELTQYKYKRRGNLHGMYLNFSIVMDFPPKSVDMLTYLTTPIDRHLDTMHRYNYALILYLKDYYNFTINLMRGETWGYLINGTFNGIVGDMLKGIVDIGASPFQFKPERLDVMDYTVQGYMARAVIIFRHPERQELSNSFFEPFSRSVWILTVIVGLLNWLLMYVTIRFEKHFLRHDKTSSLYTKTESETFLITTAAICQQGLSDAPQVYSGRIVYMSLFLWALLLYQFYSASIVGSLLAEKPRFIKTIKDLTYSNLEVGIENMPYNHDFFRTTTDKTIIELFKRKIALNKKRKKYPYYTAEEGLKKVQAGGFAFQVDLATAYKFITETFNENEICDLHEIQLFEPKHTATCTSKHSPFKKMVTYGLRQVVEHGMTRRLESIWKHKQPECPESHNSTPTPVNLNQFSPALVMFSAAIALAIFIMLVENIVRKYACWLNSSVLVLED